jgi:zinc D-Ala-D-Ala carboxypeptidase
VQLTEHFTLEEMQHSDKAADIGVLNICPPGFYKNLQFTALGLERIRACLMGFPIKILSGYRCPDLNRYVKGARDSQHVVGEAADFICPGYGPPRDICIRLQTNIKTLGVDQLIMEGTWVHVSFTMEPRHETLTFKNGIYVKGIA